MLVAWYLTFGARASAETVMTLLFHNPYNMWVSLVMNFTMIVPFLIVLKLEIYNERIYEKLYVLQSETYIIYICICVPGRKWYYVLFLLNGLWRLGQDIMILLDIGVSFYFFFFSASDQLVVHIANFQNICQTYYTCRKKT